MNTVIRYRHIKRPKSTFTETWASNDGARLDTELDLIWDAIVPDFPGGEREIHIMRLDVRLPDRRKVETGYGTFWPQQRLNAAELLRLGAEAGFEVSGCAEDGLSFAIDLRKPGIEEQRLN